MRPTRYRWAKRNLCQVQISLLSRDDLTIDELKALLSYFTYHKDSSDGKSTANRAWTLLSYIKERREAVRNTWEYKSLLGIFFYGYQEKTFALSEDQKIRVFKIYKFLFRHIKKSCIHILDDYLWQICSEKSSVGVVL